MSMSRPRGRPPSNSGDSNNTPQALQTFAPSLSFELITLNQIERVMMAPVTASSLGDMTRAHAMERELILFFDDWVYANLFVLKSNYPSRLNEYFSARDKIITLWKDAKDDATEMKYAHELYRHSLIAISSMNLIKKRMYAYFTINKRMSDDEFKPVESPEDLQRVEQQED